MFLFINYGCDMFRLQSLVIFREIVYFNVYNLYVNLQ